MVIRQNPGTTKKDVHQIKMAATEAAARWKHTAVTKMYTAATKMGEARTASFLFHSQTRFLPKQ